ncbi:MAG: LPS export ABC transporter periplasmic protein LptC [Cyanobacteria bacterium TGS_CYA1]|nr:LPS export ABC transporter periplasmic protein LptC [Cyanobacteria bacterium TGS_CYA1]
MNKIKPFLKMMLALGILGGIVGSIYYAQIHADIEMKKFQESSKSTDPEDTITIDNYELKEVDDTNALKWILTAKKAILEPATRLVDLKEIEVKYYSGPNISMRLQSPLGKANEATKVVTLTANEKAKVIGIGEENKSRLETKAMELRKKNEFVCTGGVNIDWPGVAKVTGNTAQGTISSSKMQNMLIKGNTHSILN